MNPKYKITNVRATSLHRDMIAENSIDTLVNRSEIKTREQELTKLSIYFDPFLSSFSDKEACILFDLGIGRDKITVWCYEREFHYYKFVLDTFQEGIKTYRMNSEVTGKPGYTLNFLFK